MELGRMGKNECYFMSIKREIEEKSDLMEKLMMDVGMVKKIKEGG
jgi:hypothetical protein